MLGQRIVTAVVLLGLLVAALSASSPWPFAWLTLALVCAAGWEWGRLNAAGPKGSWALALSVGVACWLSLQAGWADGHDGHALRGKGLFVAADYRARLAAFTRGDAHPEHDSR